MAEVRTVGSIATRSLITIADNKPAKLALDLLVARHVSSLVVVTSSGEPVGLVSATDLLRQRDVQNPSVRDVMTPTLMSIDVETPVTTAARLMSTSHIHRLLVTEAGKLIGLVSLTDIARLVGSVGLRGEPPPDDGLLAIGLDISSPSGLVQASLARSNANGQLAKKFYELFVDASPMIARHFETTDMATQRRAIGEAFQLAIDVACNTPGALAQLRVQAEHHDRRHLNVLPELYDVWLSSLIHSIRQCDPLFSPFVEQAWRIVMGHVIDYMRRRWD
ncbi:MAG TPA: CBS domain-containing protein [Polyangiaceae bacterium]|nr:CBS domain-containing protein [Polyangiaceae bacterium]